MDVIHTHAVMSSNNTEGMSPPGVAENNQIILSGDTSAECDLQMSLSPRGPSPENLPGCRLSPSSSVVLSRSIKKQTLQDILKLVKPRHTWAARVGVQTCVCSPSRGATCRPTLSWSAVSHALRQRFYGWSFEMTSRLRDQGWEEPCPNGEIISGEKASFPKEIRAQRIQINVDMARAFRLIRSFKKLITPDPTLKSETLRQSVTFWSWNVKMNRRETKVWVKSYVG